MYCSFCGKKLPPRCLNIHNFALCRGCQAHLIAQDPSRREYDWFAAWVRRGLVEPLLTEAARRWPLP